MTNPTPRDPALVVGRLTLGDIIDYCAGILGRKGNLTSEETAFLKDMINREQQEWRLRLSQGIGGFAEAETDVPASGWVEGDTSVALPENFHTLRTGHIYRLDAGGGVQDKVPVIEIGDYYDAHARGVGLYDKADPPVAYLHRATSGFQRILTLFPPPAGGKKFRVLYYRRTEKLVNLSDVLEAPVVAHDGIQYGSAARFCTFRGPREKVSELKALKEEQVRLVTSPPAREVQRKPRRMRRFDDRAVDGYRGFRPDVPFASK